NTLKISDGGEIFVLDMGEQIKIADLAKNLIILSGLKPNRDIKIVYTGLRKGEKLFEEILTSKDNATATKLEKIYIAYPQKTSDTLLINTLKKMKKLLQTNDDIDADLKKLILTLVPEFIINHQN
ncbi:MAG TPA: polysaccharide biosynthesis protein, partial [bacterium]|nr:polysaccharide biosynthesis protein [bacterium]